MFRGFCARLGDDTDVVETMAGTDVRGSQSALIVVVESPSDEVVEATRLDLQNLITVAYSWTYGELRLPSVLAAAVETFVMEATMMVTDSVDRLVVHASAFSFRWQQLREEIAHLKRAQASSSSSSSMQISPPPPITADTEPADDTFIGTTYDGPAAIEDSPWRDELWSQDLTRKIEKR